MPTYQYACTACEHRLEAVQSFSDDPLTECPSCQGQLRKLFSAVGIVFKGSGFYRTDSRSDARGGSKKSNSDKELASVSSGPNDSSPSGTGAASNGSATSRGGSSGDSASGSATSGGSGSGTSSSAGSSSSASSSSASSSKDSSSKGSSK